MRLARPITILFAAAWALGAFTFAVAHPTWTERAVLQNALGDPEQRALTFTMLAALGAMGILAGSRAIGAHRRKGDVDAALAPLVRASFVALPLGFYGLYRAKLSEPVLLAVTVTIAGLAAYAAHEISAAGVIGLESVSPKIERALPTIVVALATAHAITIAAVARMRFELLSSGWDLAIYDQVHWNIVDSGIPWSTMYSATESENHYAIHFSPIYHLSALVYAVRKSPDTLTSLQCAALAAGALPLFAIARRKTGSAWIALAFAISYLANPCVHSISVYEFHEIAFFVPLVLGIAWALEAERPRAFWVLVALALIVREDTALHIFFFALYLGATDRRPLAIRLGVASLGYLALTHGVFIPALRHLRPFSFHDRFLDLQRFGTHGTSSILETLITNPTFCVQYVIGSPARLDFLALVLLPVAFLPLRSGRALLLLVPGLFFSLMSSFEPQYSIWGHYTAPFLGALYYAAVVGVASIDDRRRRLAMVTAAAVASLLLSGKVGRYEWLNPGFARDDRAGRDRYGADAERIRAVARSVPERDSVRATNNLLSLVSGRRHAFILPGGPGADWAFIDYRRDAMHAPATFESVRALCDELLSSADYGVIHLDDHVVVLRKGADPSRNADARARITSADN